MAQDVTPWLLMSNCILPSPPCLCVLRGSSSFLLLYANYPHYYHGDINAPSSGFSAASLPLSALLAPLPTKAVSGPAEQIFLLPLCLRWSSNSCFSQQPLCWPSSWDLFPISYHPSHQHGFLPTPFALWRAGLVFQGEILALDIGLCWSSGSTRTKTHSSSPTTPRWAQPHPSQTHTSALRPAQSCAKPALPSRKLPVASMGFSFIWCTHKLASGCLSLLNPLYICRFSVGSHAFQSNFWSDG